VRASKICGWDVVVISQKEKKKHGEQLPCLSAGAVDQRATGCWYVLFD
jgi:hypothetical protein